MRTHDQIWDDAKDEIPFSNGTSGDIWMSRWCAAPCRKDRNEDCPIIMVAYMGRTPKEWTEVGLQDYTCSEFEPDDDGGDADGTPVPEPDPPIVGQVDIFEVFTDQFVTEVAKERQPA
jgi:hypothetical protein